MSSEFHISLNGRSVPAGQQATDHCREYRDDTDSVLSLLQDICEEIADLDAAHFVVRGFGQSWPVDVHTDLVTLLEQLPDALEGSRRHERFIIDFYEQGVERTLTFVPTKEGWQITCDSRTSWVPHPSVHAASTQEMEQMLSHVADEFFCLAEKIAPRLREHKWLREWEKQLS